MNVNEFTAPVLVNRLDYLNKRIAANEHNGDQIITNMLDDMVQKITARINELHKTNPLVNSVTNKVQAAQDLVELLVTTIKTDIGASHTKQQEMSCCLIMARNALEKAKQDHLLPKARYYLHHSSC